MPQSQKWFPLLPDISIAPNLPKSAIYKKKIIVRFILFGKDERFY